MTPLLLRTHYGNSLTLWIHKVSVVTGHKLALVQFSLKGPNNYFLSEKSTFKNSNWEHLAEDFFRHECEKTLC